MSFRLRSIRLIAGGLMLAGAVLMTSVQPAAAQFGQAVAISELMKPEFLNRDMIIFVEGLELDSEQQVIVESMFESYRDEFDAGINELRASFEEMRTQLNPDDPQRVLKMVFAPFDDWRDKRDVIRQRFIDNVKLVLNDRQLAMWDDFQKRLRREKSLDRGVLSGEQLNLFHVLQDMAIDERTRLSIEPVLNAYANELDAALRRRNEAINDIQGEMLQAMQEQDSNRMLDVLGHQIDLRLAVRNVNDRYIEAVANALPDHFADEFRERAMDRAYPRVFRRSSAEELFEAALKLDALDPDKREAVREIYETYTVAMESSNQRLLEMIRVHEPRSERHRAEAAAARMANEPYSRLPNPTIVEYRKRDEMVRHNVELLKWTIGEELFAQLPGASRWARPERREPRTTPTADDDGRSGVTSDAAGHSRMLSESAGSEEDTNNRGRGGKKGKDPDNPGPPPE